MPGVRALTELQKEVFMFIQKYTTADENALFDMLREEGGGWSDYYEEPGRVRYRKALQSGIVYLLYVEEVLCGFIRCHEDCGFGVYIHDLLVRKRCRGNQYGRLLMEQVRRDFPNQAAYVLSDVDPYYEKLGYQNIGTVFEVKP
jgi:ribosomal protein S18 acetylase RimI-like enzyme